jgi:fumarate hydratase class II
MNVNEVIAALASEQIERPVHANDHVNCSQSSNDVIPTAIHVSASLAIDQQLLPALQQLQTSIALRAYREGRPIVDVAMEMTDLDEARLRQLLDPENLV